MGQGENGMAFRLVAKIDGRTVRIALPAEEQTLGSHPGCPVRLNHPSISRRHALVRLFDDHVFVEDLGSRNGTRAGGRRVRSHKWVPGESMQFGVVEATLESLPAEDLEAGLTLDGKGTAAPIAWTGCHSTHGSGPIEAFALNHLPVLLRRLSHSSDGVGMAQAVGEAVCSALPCLAAEIIVTGTGGLVFRVERDEGHDIEKTPVEADCGGLTLRVSFPSSHLANAFRPLVECAAALVEAAQADSPAAPPPPPRPPAPPLPDPPTVVPALREVYTAAERVARGDVGVLILGESGTGKDLLARYIHQASRVAPGPFLGLNCASLPRDLLEAELFGVEKGVATGVDARPGKFELAHGGTLFLDEVADMAPETQARILRVLQSGEVYRLGGREPRTVQVRTIAATNRDIRFLLREGQFREDLYHRIAGWVVHLPPLRQRRADIPNLAAHFLTREGRRQGIRVAGISRAALDALAAYPWPGNVRQLENEMARAALFLDDGELLDTARLSEEVARCRVESRASSLAETLNRVERDEIVLALATCGGDIDRTAARLGISRATLYRRMKTLQIYD
jgi:hypothetical protein